MSPVKDALAGEASAAVQAVGDAAASALNAGIATGRVRTGQAAAALVSALAHNPDIMARAESLARELGDAAAGRAVRTPARGDRRFTDPAWQENPFYRRLGQAYLATENAINDAVENADVDWRTSQRAKLAAAMLTTAMAPTNTLPGNPAALKHAFDTGGLSLVRGARNLAADVRAGRRTPSQVDTRPFQLGENIGASPGAVVFRNEVVEIIQYAPTTPQVHTVPLLIVWSLINRFYILDLAPGRSFIEYAVSQGIGVFVTSWRNPGREQAGWDLDTYATALLEAVDAVAEISGSDQVGTMGLCAGGQLLAALLAHLAARGDDRVAYSCFGVSQLDMSVPSVAGLAVAAPLPGLARFVTRATKVVDGRDIAGAFSWLRPGELVWNYWVNNYLMGQDPPAFDILAWNADTTRLPGEAARQLLRLGEENLLAVPGGMTLLGTSVDLAKVAVPAYVFGAETDHLVPWRAAYQTTQLLGGEATFVLSGGGHIQHLVNPPGNPKSRYRTGPAPAADADAWLMAAETHQGTWWGHWAQWVQAHSGAARKARTRLGSRKHQPSDPAPGAYVRQK
ncbi:MAG TPA: alpha/beta fold hydrolase [Streptosporangiaceae bacterium]|nr:alpha/beta fold hydrolase [Streptosporangiaceae bacterium]